ncbi:hypothetical protein DFH08DRAFT_815078 [Mycena albidolilacea]|uniref:SGNH hydrolase-type esterase domain-containing protein n=1 Tax=Mycena albidolilacea TaxID=1033008 RepID=A0AAD6ZND9_9AGAR|nr:hypothetical protein DFH08DRAFT_815078 [Mycena albidolilacea]
MRLHLPCVATIIACFALNAWLVSWGSPASSRRAVIPALKAQIDAAVQRTSQLTHYFWTGTLPPFRGREDSIEPRARDAARRLGGTTLEDTLAGINMPLWADRTQDSMVTWTYASQLYANASRGVAYVFRGEQVRDGNVFDTLEYDALVNNQAVTAIYQINVHLSNEDQPLLLWPAQTPAKVETQLQSTVAVSCSIFHVPASGSINVPPQRSNFSRTRATNISMAVKAPPPIQEHIRYDVEPYASFDGDSDFVAPIFRRTISYVYGREPTAINYGNGWVPYATACPWGTDISKMGGLRLRALPAGDSITFGFQSTTGNGYRYNLQQVIQAPPWAGGLQSRANLVDNDTSNIVDFIRSQDSGTMPDPDNEGHSGAEIAAIGGYLLPDLSQNPNVVFLLAGTNDINNNDDIDNAPARLMSVVDSITSALPKTAVLVGTIPLNGDATKEQWSGRYGRFSSSKVNISRRYTLLQTLNSGGFTVIRDTQRWLTLGSVGCVWYPQGEIANGAGLGFNGGLYDCSRKPLLNVLASSRSRMHPPTGLPPSGKCSDLNDNSTAVRFADLNGDGRAEYLWLDTQGATTAFLNLGSTQTGQPLVFFLFMRRINAGQVGWLPSGIIATGVGAPRHQVHFADINGDGRAEYLWVHDDGSVDAWLNLGGPDNGPNAAKVIWQPQGQIASGIGKNGTGVRFADLNGDGRAEYLWIDDDGAMTGDGRADYLTVTHTGGAVELWLNGGGPDDGPNAAKVVWYPQGIIATGVGTSGMGVQFADLNGDGRTEYLDVNYETSAVNAWLNGCAFLNNLLHFGPFLLANFDIFVVYIPVGNVQFFEFGECDFVTLPGSGEFGLDFGNIPYLCGFFEQCSTIFPEAHYIFRHLLPAEDPQLHRGLSTIPTDIHTRESLEGDNEGLGGRFIPADKQDIS